MRARAICVARKFSRSIWVKVKPDVRPEKSAKRIMAAIAAEHIASTSVNPACAFGRSTCPEQTTINVRCNQQASGLLSSLYSRRYTIIWCYLRNKQLENRACRRSAMRPACDHPADLALTASHRVLDCRRGARQFGEVYFPQVDRRQRVAAHKVFAPDGKPSQG